MGDAAMQIHIQNLQLQLQDRMILEIPDIHLPIAGITAVVGPNGCGKTSLIRYLSRLLDDPKSTLQIPFPSQAVVFHQTPFIRTTVKNNLMLLRDSFPDIAERDVEETLEQFHLLHLKNQSATLLSAGEKQRVALARAQLMKPALILLDEPTANMDPGATDAMEHILLTMVGNGTKMLLATHDLSVVRRHCEWVVFMHEGKIIEVTPKLEFFQTPQSSEAKRFLERTLGWATPL